MRVANRATRAALEIPAGREVLRLQARQPGSREHLRVSVDYDRVERTPDKFNLVIQRVSRPGSQLVDDQEVFDGLVDGPDRRALHRRRAAGLRARAARRAVAELPACADARRESRPADSLYNASSKPGSDGEELTDYDVIGSNAEGTGLFALDRCERIDLVCVPSPPGRDLGSTSFLAATRYCERRRALLVWDPPWAWTSADSAVLALRASGQASRHAVTYFPRVRPRGDLGRYGAGMPACGVVAGMLARCDQGGVWHRMPPVDTTLKGGLAPLARDRPEAGRELCSAWASTRSCACSRASRRCKATSASRARPRVDSLWQSLSASRLRCVHRALDRGSRRAGCSRPSGPISSRPISSGKCGSSCRD